MGLLTTLLTIACVCVTFLVAFYRLWQYPPVIRISFADLTIPDKLTIALTTQIVPADVEMKASEEPIPEDILDYISQESEVHAQDSRKRRVRALKIDTGSWTAAFRLLQKEDNPLD